MLKRILFLCVGLMGAAGGSQAPEFTQQYLQRLGGWVDSYQDRVARLDSRAKQFNMTREQYIAALQASTDPKVRNEAANIASWPVYLKRYTEMQQILQNGPVWMQPVRLFQSYSDPAFAPIIQATWKDYKFGTQLTGTGAAFASAGFVLGWLAMVAGMAAAMMPVKAIRRRREKPKNLPNLVTHKIEPLLDTAQAEQETYSGQTAEEAVEDGGAEKA
jgi:hypothetical protein